jgi:acyl dehydratase
MPIPGYRYATLSEFVGRDLGCSEWITIDQDRIDRFAECTGDHQWIHVDVERARRESAGGTTIAHGLLILAMLAPLQMSMGVIPEDVARAVHRGIDRVRFVGPVSAGARIRNHAGMLSVDARRRVGTLIRLANTIEVEGARTPAITCENVALLEPPLKTAPGSGNRP